MFYNQRKLGVDIFAYYDPYYCGLRARVPNFVKGGAAAAGGKHALPAMTERLSLKDAPVPSKRYSVAHPHPGPFLPPFAHGVLPPAALWHARSYESGIGAYETRNTKKEKIMYQFYPEREKRIRPMLIQQPR
ncbi:hypothetical protein EVAR_45360_1 [Eumeta japonica]|uniref:Uncharacterized protein n=1 Tax=Eumeta variegata TaxID=151549 RepID=A0A4C1XZS4_EUMVA|nr:hypothetical protein EVAR_45360_1 [Eumeta japonica]